MDPTAALESILNGHEVLDHAEALRDWCQSGGFESEPRFIPVSCPVWLGCYRKDRDVTATRQGLEMTDRLGRRRLLLHWFEVISYARVSDELGYLPSHEKAPR